MMFGLGLGGLSFTSGGRLGSLSNGLPDGYAILLTDSGSAVVDTEGMVYIVRIA